MRAIVTEDFGGPPTMTDLPAPRPGPGEVRVRVLASSLNGFDVACAGGYLKDLMEHRFPVVLGRDYAGTVDLVGEGVTAFAPGDDVFGVVLTQPLNAGAFAEYLVVPQDHNIAYLPAGLDHATAGVIGLAGAAAVASLDAVAAEDGEILLVSGATGGVGTFLLQFATARGVRVIATAAPGDETDHVRALGAAHVVDRTRDLAPQVRAIAPEGVHAALHLAGDPFALADLVAGGGRFASLLGIDPEQFAGRDLTAIPVYANPHGALLDALAGGVVDGTLAVPVRRTYPLAGVPAAFADFAAGTTGKLAVTIE
jgi:NADPH:quinone reductase-like Zn-dependent oxidoreductase